MATDHDLPQLGNKYYRLGVAGIPEGSLSFMNSAVNSEFTFHLRPEHPSQPDGSDVDNVLSTSINSRASRSPGRKSAPKSPRMGSRSPLPDSTGFRPRSSSKNGSIQSKLNTLPLTTSALYNRYFPTNEMELKKKIQALEDTVAEYERQKDSVMGTFKDFRERLADKERMLETEYSTRIISLSEDVLAAKRDFESRMREYQSAQERSERDKMEALERLKRDHQKEIQTLEKRCSESHLVPDLERRYIMEIQRLEEERKTLKTEKERLGEVFESKLRRAQSLYESELASARALYKNEISALKDHEAALREELKGRQEEFRDKLDSMQSQFSASRAELAKCKKEVAELEERLKQKEIEVEDISNQLQKARTENQIAIARFQDSQHDCQEFESRMCEQNEQLMRKDESINTLEDAKCRLENVIADLRMETETLKKKIQFLESERRNLESQQFSQSKEQETQILILQKMAESLSVEKQKSRSDFDQQLEAESLQSEERFYKLEKAHKDEMEELAHQHKLYKEQMETKLTQEKESLHKQFQLEYENQLSVLKKDNEKLMFEISEMRDHMRLNCGPTCLLVHDRTVTEEENRKDSVREKENEELSEKTSKLKELDSELAKTRQEIAELERTKQDNANEINENQQTLVSLQEEIKNLKDEKQNLVDQISNVNQNDVNEELPNNSKLQEQLSEQDSEIRSLKSEISTLESRIKEYVIESEANQRAMASKYGAVSVESYTSPDPELNKPEVDPDKFRELEESFTAKELELSSIKSNTLAMNEEISRLAEELEEKKEQIIAMRRETQAYIQKRERQTSRSHKKEIEKLEKELAKKTAAAAAAVAAADTPSSTPASVCNTSSDEDSGGSGPSPPASVIRDSVNIDLPVDLAISDAPEIPISAGEIEDLEELVEDVDFEEDVAGEENAETDGDRSSTLDITVTDEIIIAHHEEAQLDTPAETSTTPKVSTESKETIDTPLEVPQPEVAVKGDNDLKQILSRKDEEMKRIQDEKQKLEAELAETKKMLSQQPASGGLGGRRDSMASSVSSVGSDHLKKRDSLSSTTSSSAGDKPPSSCAGINKRANMAIVHKWQCLVNKMKQESESGSSGPISRRQVTPMPLKSCSRSHHASNSSSLSRDKSPAVSSRTMVGSSRNSISSRTSSIASNLNATGSEERESRRDNSLRLPAVNHPRRNSGTSPSRSPLSRRRPESLKERPPWKN